MCDFVLLLSSDETDPCLSRPPSNTSEGSGDSLFFTNHQKSRQSGAPAEEGHLLQSVEEFDAHDVQLAKFKNDISSVQQSINVTNCSLQSDTVLSQTAPSEACTCFSEENSSQNIVYNGAVIQHLSSDDELTSGVSIMTSAPLTSANSHRQKSHCHQQGLNVNSNDQNTASQMANYTLADIANANTTWVHSDNPPTAFTPQIDVNTPSLERPNISDISSIPDSLIASSANEYMGCSEDSESIMSSSNDHDYVGGLPSSNPQPSHQEEADIEILNVRSNAGFCIDPKILQMNKFHKDSFV